MFDLLRHLPKDLVSRSSSLFLAEGRHSHSSGAWFIKQPLSIEMKQVLQPYNTRMIDLQKIVELAIGAFGVDEILKGIDDLFNSDHPPRFLVASLVDHTIGALSYLVKDLVLLIDLVI